MAILALGIAGAALAPAGWGAVGWAVGQFAGQLLFGEKQRVVREGPRFQDTRVQASTYGAGITVPFGTVPCAGNLIWSTAVREIVTENTEEVGKGGGQEVTNRTYSYFADYAIGICAGPIIGVRRIWANGELIYDVGPSASLETVMASNANAGNMRIYLGSETQLPDPTIEATVGAGAVPGHRGLAYVVFTNHEVTSYGARIPTYRFEVVSAGSVAELAYATTYTNPTDCGFEAPKFGARDVFAMLIDYSGSTSNQIAFFNSVNGQLHALSRPFNSGNLNNLGLPTLTCERPAMDKGGTAWTAGRGTLGAFSGTWLLGVNPLGEVIKIILLSTSSVQNNGNLAINQDNDVYFKLSGNAIKRLNLDESPNYSAGATALTHIYDAGSLIAATNRMCADREGNGWWREVDGTTAYLTRLRRDGPRRAVIAGFNTADYPVSNNQSINFDTGNTPWVCWFEGAGASRHAVLKKLDPETAAILQTITLPNVGGTTFQGLQDWVFGEDGFLYVLYSGSGTSGRWYKVELSSGTVVYQSALSAFTSGGSVGTRTGVFWGELQSGPQEVRALEPLPRLTASSAETLETTVREICQLAGMQLTEITTTALTDTVDGYLIGRPMAARAAIEQLQKAFFFDAVESDDTLKFVKRGGASAVSIPAADLGASESGTGDPEPAVWKSRLQEIECPRQVTVNFWNKDADYAESTEYARRLVTAAKEQVIEDLPLAIAPTKAAQIADSLLFTLHMERNRFKWKTSLKYARYEPTDVMTLTDEGGSTFTVLPLAKRESGMRIEWEGAAADAPTYSSSAIGTTSQSGQAGIVVPGATIVDLLDIPIVSSSHDEAGFYAAFSPLSGTGRGAELYGSADNVAYSPIGSSSSLTVSGAANTALANFAGGNTWDNMGSVEVTLNSGSLASATELEVLNGANLALLGSELIQFRTAAFVSGTKYTLSGLLRGRRGTEWAMGSHVAGDRFVLLRTAGVIRVVRPESELNVARFYRPVTFGSTLAEASTYSFTNSGAGLKPLSPVFINGTRNSPSTNDWTITWVRRGRVDWDWRDYVDVPLGETTEEYVVEILNVTTGALVRTLSTVTSPSATYTAAQQSTDFGGAQSTIRVRVYQISAAIGRGFPGEAQISG